MNEPSGALVGILSRIALRPFHTHLNQPPQPTTTTTQPGDRPRVPAAAAEALPLAAPQAGAGGADGLRQGGGRGGGRGGLGGPRGLQGRAPAAVQRRPPRLPRGASAGQGSYTVGLARNACTVRRASIESTERTHTYTQAHESPAGLPESTWRKLQDLRAKQSGVAELQVGGWLSGRPYT